MEKRITQTNTKVLESVKSDIRRFILDSSEGYTTDLNGNVPDFDNFMVEFQMDDKNKVKIDSNRIYIADSSTFIIVNLVDVSIIANIGSDKLQILKSAGFPTDNLKSGLRLEHKDHDMKYIPKFVAYILTYIKKNNCKIINKDD